MGPKTVAAALRRIASNIERSNKPSIRLVSRDLKRVIASMDLSDTAAVQNTFENIYENMVDVNTISSQHGGMQVIEGPWPMAELEAIGISVSVTVGGGERTARLLASFTHHHSSEKSPWRQFVESEAEALHVALEGEFGYDLSIPECEDLLAIAKKEGEATTHDDEEGTFTVWWEPAEKAFRGKNEKIEPNFGVGEGSSVAGTDKYRSVWIAFEDSNNGEAAVAVGYEGSADNVYQVPLAQWDNAAAAAATAKAIEDTIKAYNIVV